MDLVVARCDFLAITGPSGSGKSTLLNVIGLLDRPSEGQYLICGENVLGLREALRTAVRAAMFGFVFQSFHLLGGRSSVENVGLGSLYRFPSRAERRAAALAALAMVGLEHRTDTPAQVLSGGEQQRVAIARAIVGRPLVLLCDEPTGNLDQQTASGVLDLLDALVDSGLTVVVVTHDPTVSARARRVLRVENGVLL